MATGFFGKLPVSGDFVARGLPPGVRPAVDRWLTQILAPCTRRPERWPQDGLRALIAQDATALALLVLPSHDAAGRKFPLAAVAQAEDAGQGEIDAWAEAVLPALQLAAEKALGPDQLIAVLEQVPAPLSGVALRPPLLWAHAMPPKDPAAFVAAMADI